MFRINKTRFTFASIGKTWLRAKELVPVVSFLLAVTRANFVKAPLIAFAQRLQQLLLKSGSTMSVQYLKRATLAVYAWRVGKRLPSYEPGQPVIAMDKSGLPKILPWPLRRLMPTRPMAVKLALTVLALYRVIRAPGKLKLSTIVDPYKGVIQCSDLQQEIAVVLDEAFGKHRGSFFFKFSWRYSLSAGPNRKLAVWSALWDALAFYKEPQVLVSFMILAPWWISLYVLCLGLLMLCTPRALKRFAGFGKVLCLGRLCEKEEAAGKVRVFAITDWWSQGLLSGLHHFLFGLLRPIEQDGTFDQLRPLRSLLERVRLGLPTYSYDLSAATDRLPVDLQVMVLRYFFRKPWQASIWKSLLVGRAWYHEGLPLYYSVGQPMGALSSWAMLALTHHVLVQVAARRVGHEVWFRDYAVLGDDIVIANEHVAAAYLHLMTQLGVDISLAKSLISEGGCVEFAKRLMSPAFDYTPLGPGALLQAWRNPAYVNALATDLRDKAFGVLPQHWLANLGELTSHYPKGKRGLATLAIYAAVGPAGGLEADLPLWISKENHNWASGALLPAVVTALQWTVNTAQKKAVSTATKSIMSRWNDLLKAWRGSASGLPWPVMLLAPGPWIYSTLVDKSIEVELGSGPLTQTGGGVDWATSAENQQKRLHANAAINWDNISAAQIASLLGLEVALAPELEIPARKVTARLSQVARLRTDTHKMIERLQPDPFAWWRRSAGLVTVWKPRSFALVPAGVYGNVKPLRY